ncbi:MAG: hypothetical protein KBD63_06180 [Bacteriovoracaceae bacterium]|nr:hypothetical protein [Bacteriovoracaceae bacterium]
MKNFISFFSLLFLLSCGLTETRPTLEMSLAAEAFLAAKDADADTHSPNLFRQAEVYYLKAKSAYRRKYFAKAKEYAIRSQEFSEKAEFTARRKLLVDQK